ncbi:hypothetical protein DID74_00255 [Candidatus Marinamargulisbacteria bacterium SCGC AG-333-B06]|nr:hypothetical protein DID74_00255 [Candidatus Marinamargulisbacteria bacterium SCGC AG-333-B06]
MSFIYQIKQLGKESFIYGFGSSLTQILTILIAPILTQIFSPAEYGVLALVQSTFAILIMLASANIESGVFYYYYDEKESINNQKKVIGTGFSYYLLASTSLALLCWISAPGINYLLSLRAESATINYIPYIKILAVGSLFTMLSKYYQLLLRIQRQPIKYIFVGISQVFVQLSTILILVVYLDQGLTGIFMSNVIAAVIAMGVGLYFSRHILTIQFSIHYFKRINSYSLPQFPSVIIQALLNQSNRFFLNAFVPLTQLGYFAIAERYKGLYFIGVQAFITAWGPYALSIMKEKCAKDIYKRVFDIYCLCFCILGITLSLLAKPIFMIFLSRDYIQGASIVFILILGAFFTGLNTILGIGIGITKQTKYISYIQCIVFIINLTLNFLLIPKLGMVGAAIALAASFFSQTILNYYISKKLYPIEYDYWPKVSLVLVCFSLSGLFIFLTWNFSIINTIALGTLLIWFITYLLIKISITPKQRQYLVHTIVSYSKKRLLFN